MPDLTPALDALDRLVDKVGAPGATLAVVVVALAVTFYKWAPKFLTYDIERRKLDLETAKFNQDKRLEDAALREHGALTLRALRSGIDKLPKRGRGGGKDHG